VFGIFRKLCSVFVRFFVISYAGVYLQLIIGLIGVFGLCCFIVVCVLGTFEVHVCVFPYVSFCTRFVYIFRVCFISFW
jgi:hypothetical protein